MRVDRADPVAVASSLYYYPQTKPLDMAKGASTNLTPPQKLEEKKSVKEPKVKSLITIQLPSILVLLISRLLLNSHCAPLGLLLLVQVRQILSLGDEGEQAQAADGQQDSVALLVVRGVVCSVDLRAGEGSKLYDDVVSGRRDGPLLDVESVLRNPRGNDRVEIRVYSKPSALASAEL